MKDMEYIYRLNGISFSYETNLPLFRDLDLLIPLHGLTLINGGNGAGKTTLCRLLTGLNKGYEGSLKLFDEELRGLDRSAVLDRVIYIKQDLTGNLMGITPDEDLNIWQNRFSESDSPEKAKERKEALKLMGTDSLVETPIWELSYGQKRRTMLAVLPLFMDKYWILDEPTASLDEKGITLLKELLMLKRRENCGALILTHRTEIFRGIVNCNNAPVSAKDGRTESINGDSFLLAEGKIGELEL